MLGQEEEVFEHSVLPNRLRSAPPLNKFELSNSKGCFEIKRPARVSRAKRNIFYSFIWFENVRQAQEYAEGMNDDVDLANDPFYGSCAGQSLTRRTVRFQEGWQISRRCSAYRVLDSCKRCRQIGAAK